MPELTSQPIRRIIKKAGAKRISDNAVREMAAILEKRASDIVREAWKISEHSDRRTVMRKDVRMARTSMKKHI